MTDPTRPPAPLTPPVFHILLALADGPLHGYGVMKRVEADSGLAMGPGTVYGGLQRLEDAGWVSVGAEDDRDSRRGRLFHLTDEGRSALRSEAARITRLARLDGVREWAPDPGR